MTLDEAIEHCDDKIKSCEKGCALDHLQLKSWLIELKGNRKVCTELVCQYMREISKGGSNAIYWNEETEMNFKKIFMK